MQRLGVTRPDFWGCWAFSNHDVVRAASRLSTGGGSPREVAELSLALLLSFRGTPCIYQGEELGLEEVDIPFEQLVDPYGIAFYPEFKGRDGCRTPMPWQHDLENAGFCPEEVKPWLPIPSGHRAKSVDATRKESNSPYMVMKEVIAHRKVYPSLALGEMVMLDLHPRLLAFQRLLDDETTQCVFNLSSEMVEIAVPESYSSGSRIGNGIHERAQGETLSMKPWSWYIHTL